jgi:hypothetical protein
MKSAVFGFLSWLAFWTVIMYQIALIRLPYMGSNTRYAFAENLYNHAFQGLIAFALYAGFRSFGFLKNRMASFAFIRR